MEMMIVKLADMDINDPRSKIMVNHMAWPMRVDIFGALADQLVADNPRLKDYPTVISLLKKAQEGRNRIVHGFWGLEDGKVTALRVTARGKLKFSMQEVALQEIEGIFQDINVANAALYNLVLGN
jgi:hypothetical protein